MGRYFLIQCKRMLRMVPAVLCAVLVLTVSLFGIYRGIVQLSTDPDAQTKFKIAMVGQSEDTFLDLAIQAVEAFDSSRFSIELLRMQEDEAAAALARGDIPAYVVIPEGFIEAALHGQVLTLDFVSTSGAAGLVSLFKDELTRVVEDIVIACQKGMFGVTQALTENGGEALADQFVHDISIQYVEFVFTRADTYTVRELGIGDSLKLEGYLLCGFSVLLLLLMALPFAPLFIRRQCSLEQVLSAKRCGAFAQTVCEFAGFLLSECIVLLIALGAIGALLGAWEQLMDIQSLWRIFTVVLWVCTLSVLLYEISTDLVSGVLLHFFASLSLCFVCGCLYPVHFFPETVQRIARWLPASHARACLASCVTGADAAMELSVLWSCSAAALIIAVLVRRHRIVRGRG